MVSPSLGGVDPTRDPRSRGGMTTATPGRPISPIVGGVPIKQRGFYSELLDSELEPVTIEALGKSAHAGSKLPALQPRLAAPRQRAPPASQFKGMSEDARTAANEHQQSLTASAGRVSMPSRPLEPKVLVPYNPGPGKTPRAIVIERQKRLFALQDLAQARATPAHSRRITPWRAVARRARRRRRRAARSPLRSTACAAPSSAPLAAKAVPLTPSPRRPRALRARAFL